MVGVDLVNIERFEKFYKKFGKKALLRYLNPDEIELSKQRVETLSGFYAAKEAVSKALGCGIGKELGFHDIVLHKTKDNAPYFTLPKKIIKRYNINNLSLSITHEKEYAVAVAFIEADKQDILSH